MIIGTAGHIDHGKTSLVKALTGVDTDRLPEEKRRGITLELGFAPMSLPGGLLAGVVDVPGHERFVKAMAAGSGGVDLALLVVAADEGVMPQTREHLDICGLLGVRDGIVVLTKADLLPELGADWRDLLEADVAALVAGTFLEGVAVHACSSRTSEGLDALKQALAAKAVTLERRPSEGPTFLPIDRAFSLKGFGTVVTGTLLSGQLACEDAVSLLPGLVGPLRVRTLQQHGQSVPRVHAGHRVAVNLPGVDAQAVHRGMALTRHDELTVTRMLDVELTTLPAAATPLPRRSKLLLHLGTAQIEATVALLDVPELPPGGRGMAQLRLASALPALPGQRFILRGTRALPGRGATVAGGRVLALSARRHRQGSAQTLQAFADAEPEARLAWLLGQAGYRGLTARELFARSGLSQKVLARALETLGARGHAVGVDRERRLYLSADVFAGLERRALALLADFHQREPLKEGLNAGELRQRLGLIHEKTFARLLFALIDARRLEASGELLRLAGRTRTLSGGDEATHSRLVAELRAAQLAPPTVTELAARLALPAAHVIDLLRVLTADGVVVKVSEELYFEREAIARLRQRLVAHLGAHRDITTQGFKELVGQSRKFVIPLSEFFDREKVTLRVGEKRVLRRA